MPPYLRLGSIPRKRHIAHRREPGYRQEGIFYEEVVTTAGFSGAYSIVYHLRPPTRVKQIEAVGSCLVEAAPQPALRHHLLNTAGLEPFGDIATGRLPLLFNADVTLSRCRPAEPQRELYRNSAADELLFVHRGRGVMQTMFGAIPFRPFDYLLVPRATTYRLDFESIEHCDLLVIEGAGAIGPPPRYLNDAGQLKLGAPYAERDLRGPSELTPIDSEADTPILIKDGDRLTRYVMANHPFDVAGWDGLAYPFAFNADDFEPITGTIHQPPPVQQTFEAPGFVVCTFAPRMLDTHPEAIKVPYAHSNVHADEVLYYVRGQFGSRRGVDEAALTLHPRGVPHGPHPGTIVASRAATRTDELAVMLDADRPLQLTAAAEALDDPRYPYTWLD